MALKWAALLRGCLCLFLVLVWMLHLVGSFSGLVNKGAKLPNFSTLAGIGWDETQILSMLSGSNLRCVHKDCNLFQPPVSIGPWNKIIDKPEEWPPDAHTAGCQVSAPTTCLFRSAPAAPHCLLMCHVLASSYQIQEEKGLWAAV